MLPGFSPEANSKSNLKDVCAGVPGEEEKEREKERFGHGTREQTRTGWALEKRLHFDRLLMAAPARRAQGFLHPAQARHADHVVALWAHVIQMPSFFVANATILQSLVVQVVGRPAHGELAHVLSDGLHAHQHRGAHGSSRTARGSSEHSTANCHSCSSTCRGSSQNLGARRSSSGQASLALLRWFRCCLCEDSTKIKTSPLQHVQSTRTSHWKKHRVANATPFRRNQQCQDSDITLQTDKSIDQNNAFVPVNHETPPC